MSSSAVTFLPHTQQLPVVLEALGSGSSVPTGGLLHQFTDTRPRSFLGRWGSIACSTALPCCSCRCWPCDELNVAWFVTQLGGMDSVQYRVTQWRFSDLHVVPVDADIAAEVFVWRYQEVVWPCRATVTTLVARGQLYALPAIRADSVCHLAISPLQAFLFPVLQ